MLVAGITGGIASGKSTVTNIFRELGATIIDADLIAREVVEPGQPAWKKIVEHFGQDILLPDQTINRKKLGELVFNNPEQLALINKLTHPVIINTIKSRIAELKDPNAKGLLLVDVPLLIELNMMEMVDEVWLVYVDRETQLQRLQMRDGLSPEQAEARINAQMSLKDKCAFADRIIDNSKGIEHTRKQVLKIWEEIMNK
ncbi:MAG TPA: dephospho-CoA kinase [Clostridia bacterium]|jgi:dephospho-CoA kinase|nr:dephospho-CoA kinase [Clostridia bacterium]